MKVILSEEQLKKLFVSCVLNEDEIQQDTPQSEVVNNPIAKIQTANDDINSILSQTSVGDSGQDFGIQMNGAAVSNKDWLSSVKNTFNWYKQKFNNQYGQQPDPMNPNDRPDCSGFVFSALRNAGYNVGVGNTDTMVNSPTFTNAISGGFRRINWHGPADANKLPPGTILAYGSGENGKRYGHALILGDNGTSYDYGKNKHTEYSPNLKQTYTAAWVPIA